MQNTEISSLWKYTFSSLPSDANGAQQCITTGTSKWCCGAALGGMRKCKSSHFLRKKQRHHLLNAHANLKLRRLINFDKHLVKAG